MISWLASDFFARSPMLLFPVVALFLFMTAFAAVSAWALLRKREHLDRMARLPLEDETLPTDPR
jgi:hypothetical protein